MNFDTKDWTTLNYSFKAKLSPKRQWRHVSLVSMRIFNLQYSVHYPFSVSFSPYSTVYTSLYGAWNILRRVVATSFIFELLQWNNFRFSRNYDVKKIMKLLRKYFRSSSSLLNQPVVVVVVGSYWFSFV